jgi:hypothetical protein
MVCQLIHNQQYKYYFTNYIAYHQLVILCHNCNTLLKNTFRLFVSEVSGLATK